jgi:1-phosphatidylinositol-3-phosphate 5-kinase
MVARPWTGDIPLQIVGGAFSFRGVETRAEYTALAKILRLSIFCYLSLLLEQALLADAHVQLRFRKPSLAPTEGVNPEGPVRALSAGSMGKHRKRDSGQGLWAFISRKKDSLLHRAVPVRRGSLELALPLARKYRDRSHSPALRSPEDNNSPPREHRFSFITDYRPYFMQPDPAKDPIPVHRPFTAALVRIEKSKDLLSTSAGVAFHPPHLLVSLAEREKEYPDLRVGGDEKIALTSLLGWEGKHSQGSGMADTSGFVRHQSFSVLYSEYIPQAPSPSRPATPNNSQGSSLTVTITSSAGTILCGRRRRWITFRYYSRDGGADECLGEAITRMCLRADEPCDEVGCQFKKGEHELRYTHGGIRILFHTLRVSDSKEQLNEDEKLPEMWESCSVCSKESPRTQMQDGT